LRIEKNIEERKLRLDFFLKFRKFQRIKNQTLKKVAADEKDGNELGEV
jgi:hypothetical protein